MSFIYITVFQEDKYQGRIEVKFVNKNVTNLCGRVLSSAATSLLSKGFRFVPTTNKINKTKLEKELEEQARKLRLM